MRMKWRLEPIMFMCKRYNLLVIAKTTQEEEAISQFDGAYPSVEEQGLTSLVMTR